MKNCQWIFLFDFDRSILSYIHEKAMVRFYFERIVLPHLKVDFLPRKFAACSKPPCRDNDRKASYLKTQQRDQGEG